jgi:hypothetical protein
MTDVTTKISEYEYKACFLDTERRVELSIGDETVERGLERGDVGTRGRNDVTMEREDTGMSGPGERWD